MQSDLTATQKDFINNSKEDNVHDKDDESNISSTPKVQINNIEQATAHLPPLFNCADLKKNGHVWNAPEYTGPPPQVGKFYHLYVMCEKMKRVVPVGTKEEGIEYLWEFIEPKLYCVKK